MSAVNPRISTEHEFSLTVRAIEAMISEKLDLVSSNELSGVPVSLVFEDINTGRYIQVSFHEVDWEDEPES